MSDPSYTDLAVAMGRVEEKLNNVSANRENDIAFQQSVRDTFTDHEKRLTAIEANARFMKWLVPIMITVVTFVATILSNVIVG